ncbi:MAG: rod shape-determining protein MreD [Bacteroidetes bacterium]|nr:rod shape-determining protein MreD [Bacteroidota bacterium]
MSNTFIRISLRFVVLILVQVLILSNVHFLGYLNPYVYLLFILTMPFETPKWVLLITAFALGLSVDLFSNSLGMHAAASVFAAYFRPGVISLITSRKEYEPGVEPSIADLGFQWFITYTFIITFLHHFFLFLIEAFRFSGFFRTLGHSFNNALFTILIIILAQYIFYHKKK